MPQKNQGKIDPRLNVCPGYCMRKKKRGAAASRRTPLLLLLLDHHRAQTVYQSIQVLSRAHTTATAMT